MNDIIKKLFSVILAFLIVNYAFSMCNDYQVVAV
jgi:hypothetical protein